MRPHSYWSSWAVALTSPVILNQTLSLSLEASTLSAFCWIPYTSQKSTCFVKFRNHKYILLSGPIKSKYLLDFNRYNLYSFSLFYYFHIKIKSLPLSTMNIVCGEWLCVCVCVCGMCSLHMVCVCWVYICAILLLPRTRTWTSLVHFKYV